MRESLKRTELPEIRNCGKVILEKRIQEDYLL